MCNLTIERIFGLRIADTEDVSAIRVIGASADCGIVVVQLTVEGVQLPAVEAEFLQDTQPGLTRTWSAEFDVSGDRIQCGKVAVRAHAECADKPDCSADRPAPDAPPEVLECHCCPIPISSGSTETAECDDQGRVRVNVTATFYVCDATTFSWIPGSPGVIDADHPPLPVSGESGETVTIDATFFYPPSAAEERSATLYITPVTAACDPLTVSFLVPHTCGDCPTVVRLSLVELDGGNESPVSMQDANGVWTPSFDCLDPGTYIVRITDPPATLDRLSYSWTVNGAAAAADGSGREVTIDLIHQDRASVSVAVTRAGCDPPVPTGSVELRTCFCPDTVVLGIRRADAAADAPFIPGAEAEADACFKPGKYVVRITDPAALPEGARVIWQVDDVVQENQTGQQLIVDVAEGGPAVKVEAGFRDCPAHDQVTLRARTCPGPVTLRVVDSIGQTVDTTAPVEAGTYTVSVVPGDADGRHFAWTVDGKARPEDSPSLSVTFDVPPSCLPTTMTIAVSVTRCDCQAQTNSVTLTAAAKDIVCIPCELLVVVAMVFAAIAAIGFSLFLCPMVLVNPWLDELISSAGDKGAAAATAYKAFVVFYVPWIGLAAFVIAGAICGIACFVWWQLCYFSGCHIKILIWKLLAIVGITMFYFGACYECGVPVGLLIGVVCILVAIGVWMNWVDTCRPTPCRVAVEMIALSGAQTIINFLDVPLQTCAWVWGWLFLLVLTVVLWLWTGYLLVSLCVNNVGGRGSGLGVKR